MCIYLKNESGLTYIAEDHIISAALGGVSCLPKEFVSDKFNNLISKLEQDFIREGIVSIPRTVFGPGKRGNLNAAKATKSNVHLITTKEHATAKFAIGYTKLGYIIEIPSLQLNIKNGTVQFSIQNTEDFIFNDAISAFKTKCSDIGNVRIKTTYDDIIPEGIILFGIENGIEENSNCFVFKNSKTEFELSLKKIADIGSSINFDNSMPITRGYMPVGHGTSKFSSDHLRIFAKTAFNFLAHSKGKEFVLHENFDPIRNWIVNGEGDPNILLTNSLPLSAPLPQDAHAILISSTNKSIYATVLFYEFLGVNIILADNFSEGISTDGLICDWRKKKEYRLFDYILSIQN